MNHLFRNGFTLFAITLCSCGVNQFQYQTIPHSEVMSSFNTKQKVFLEFGSPDNQITIDSITSYTYNMGTIGWSRNTAIASGTYTSFTNPLYNPVFNPLVGNSKFYATQNTATRTATVNSYAKFWLIGDSVMKWETLGIDKSKQVPITPTQEDETTYYVQPNEMLPILGGIIVLLIWYLVSS